MFYVGFDKNTKSARPNAPKHKKREYKNTYVVNIDALMNKMETLLIYAPDTELKIVRKNGVNIPQTGTVPTISVPTEMVAKIIEFHKANAGTLKYKQVATIVEYLDKDINSNQRIALMASDGSTYPSDATELHAALKKTNHATRNDFAYQLNVRKQTIFMNNQIVH